MLGFTNPPRSNTYLSTVVDSVTLLEQTDLETILRNLSTALRYQPLVQETTLRIESTVIANPSKLGNAGRAKPGRGRETLVGGFTIGGSVSDSTPYLLAMYTQCLAPTYNILGGSGTTLPAEVDVVATGGDLTVITAATINDNLSSTRNPVQLVLTPEAADVVVVNAQAITGNSALTIADNLGSGGSDISGSFPLQLALTGATLTSDTTPASFAIVYVQVGGGTQTINVSFSSTELATTKTIYFDNVNTITSITPDGNFSAGTLTATLKQISIQSGILQGSVCAWGTDYYDNVIVEEFQTTRSEVLNVQTSEQYFKTVTHVYAADSASQFNPQQGGTRTVGYSAGGFKITAQDQAVDVRFPPQDREIVRFWTAIFSKGGKENIYRGLHTSEVQIAVDGNNLRSDSLTLMGQTGEVNTNLAGDTVVIDPDGPPTLPQITDVSSIAVADQNLYEGWAAVLNIDGKPMPMESCTVSLNQSISDTQLVIGERGNSGVGTRTDFRMFMMTCVFRDSKQLDFFKPFRSGKEFRNVELIFSYDAEGGFPSKEIWGMERCVITASPDPETGGVGPVQVNIVFEAFNRNRGDTPNDFYMRAELPRYSAPQTLTLSA